MKLKKLAVSANALFELTMRKGSLVGLAEGFARHYTRPPDYRDWNEKTVEYHYVRFVLRPESIANPLDGNVEALLGDLLMGNPMNQFCAIEFKARASDINSEYDKYVRTMGGTEFGSRPKELVAGKERTLPFSSWFAKENAEAVAAAGSKCHFLVYGATGNGLFEAHRFQLAYENYAGHGQRGPLSKLSDLLFCDVDMLVQYLVKLAEARLQGVPTGGGGQALIGEVQRRYAMKLDALICSNTGQYASANSFLDMFKGLTRKHPVGWKESTLTGMDERYRAIHGKAAPKQKLQSWATAVNRVYAAAMYLADMEKPTVKMVEVGKTGG